MSAKAKESSFFLVRWEAWVGLNVTDNISSCFFFLYIKQSFLRLCVCLREYIILKQYQLICLYTYKTIIYKFVIDSRWPAVCTFMLHYMSGSLRMLAVVCISTPSWALEENSPKCMEIVHFQRWNCLYHYMLLVRVAFRNLLILNFKYVV